MKTTKLNKLAAINAAVNAIYLQLNSFRKASIGVQMAVSKTGRYVLAGNRKIDVCIIFDETGYRFQITAFFGYYGQAQRMYGYNPIHSDISRLFSEAFNVSQINSDAAYSRSERAFCGA